jgi:hypothetical protein
MVPVIGGKVPTFGTSARHFRNGSSRKSASLACRATRQNSFCPKSLPNMAKPSGPAPLVSLCRRLAMCGSLLSASSSGCFRRSQPSQRPWRSTPLQRVVDRTTALLGRPRSIGVLTVIAAGWISLNLLAAALGYRPSRAQNIPTPIRGDAGGVRQHDRQGGAVGWIERPEAFR